MKPTLITALFLLISISGFSQFQQNKSILLGAHIGYQYPLGDFGEQCKGGINLRVAGELLLNPKIAVGAEINFSFLGQGDFWNGNIKGSYDTKYNIGSFLFNGIYYFDAADGDFHPYAGLGFGFFHYRYQSDFTALSSGTKSQTHQFNLNKIGLAPNIGFRYAIAEDVSFAMNLRCIYIPNIPKSVKQKDLNGNNYAYYLGFTSIMMPELSLGLYYHFN